MAEWTSNTVQTVASGAAVLFSDNPVPSENGLVWERDGTGLFELKGTKPIDSCACIKQRSTVFTIDFAANIAIPSDGDVGAISVAIAIDGVPIPSSNMEVTPAAVENYFCVSKAINAQIRRGCCGSLSIVNTSGAPILMKNANIIISLARA